MDNLPGQPKPCGGGILGRFLDEVQEPLGCRRCREAERYTVPVRMAFQPIYDAQSDSIYAYEALVRGPAGEGAGAVIAAVPPAQLYSFDQTCRVAAIQTAVALGITTRLSINFMPNAVYDPATCIRITLAAAERYGFETRQLILELNESEEMRDPAHTIKVVSDYQKRGFITAIDDFGAGHAGLNLLARFQPDLIKLDMALIRGIDTDPVRHTIVHGVLATARALGCTVIAEGIETEGEALALYRLGVRLFQGYWLARPELEALASITPAARTALGALRG